MPRISVIVPAYNVESSLAGAIASAQGQSERDLEILVVDDASTDATAAEVRRLAAADPRIVPITAARNGGPGAARNLGLDRARGQWIAPLDADDQYLPERLATLADLGEATRADLVADNLLIMDGGDGAEATLLPSGSDLAAQFWLGAAEFVEGNIGRGDRTPRSYGFLKPMLRADFLRAHSLRYPEARFAEDFLFYLDCLLCGGRWLVARRAMYAYRQREGSLTHGHSAEDLAYLIAAERALLSHPAVTADPELLAAIRRHQRSVDLAASWFGFAEALKRGDWSQAGRDLFRNPRGLAHIGKQGLRTLPRIAGKLLARPRAPWRM